MHAFDAFRQDLATSLLHCADRRRRSCAGGIGTGEDIKIIGLLERLAGDVENLDLHVFLIFELMFTHKRLARRFLRDSEPLLAQVGVLYCPASATDLVRWLTRHTIENDRQDRSPRPVPLKALAALPSPAEAPSARRGSSGKKEREAVRSWASDFSAGLGIVAPMLSLWTVGLAVQQLHDRSVIAAHPAVPATVMSVEPTRVGKSAGVAGDVVLAFEPTSGTTCQVTWHAGLPLSAGVPGQMLPVVPRSATCEMPLIPSAVGDPVKTFALAAALMAFGLASLQLWAWLFRHSPSPMRRRLWSPAVRRRHDLA